MEVVPKCSAERLFNVAVIFVGFVVGSSMVATLTAMMTQYRLQLAEKMRKMRQLHDFLAQEKSGRRLTRAIKVQINSVLRQRQRLRAAVGRQSEVSQRARHVHRAERPARVRAPGPSACRAAVASSGRGTGHHLVARRRKR